jgi:hypothetical protein
MEHNAAPLHLFIFVLGLVLLLLAAFPYPIAPSPYDSWRGRLLAAGLFFWMLSTAI